jgi:addiction module HigA family antidote
MKPRNPVHPGEILLEEFLVPMNVSQRQFARKLGWTTAKLNELVNGKRGITADSALDLADVLGTSPEVWMNLQMMWDLNKAEQRRKAS